MRPRYLRGIMSQRKLQDADFKNETDLGAASRLLNDTKIYVSALGLNKRLDQAITDGDISGANFDLESFTIDSTIKSNEYVDLANEAIDLSAQVWIDRTLLVPGLDYTQSVVLGVTRISWSGSIYANNGDAEAQTGNVIRVKYIVKP